MPRKLAVSILLLALSTPLFAAASAKKRALIEELLRVSGTAIGETVLGPTQEMQVEVYDHHLSEKQLEELIAFYKTGAGKKFVEAQAEIAAETRQRIAADLQLAVQRSKQTRTMADMRTVAIALEARATDTNSYPVSGDIEAIARLLEPTYALETPKKDAWGNPFRYIGTADAKHYRIVSGGADGRIDPASLQIGKLPPPASDDLIFEDAVFLRAEKSP
jgi:uncharacterized protein DUF2059/type II secretion system (T2SS) protein G